MTGSIQVFAIVNINAQRVDRERAYYPSFVGRGDIIAHNLYTARKQNMIIRERLYSWILAFELAFIILKTSYVQILTASRLARVYIYIQIQEYKLHTENIKST